jgi:serine/threonine-protein kinase
LKLKREVAIKILPDEFARDPERVGRFQREAEALALLNHPSIGAIYDIQEANESRFLVLELVEGETLAECLRRGPIPVEDALKIAQLIAEALEAAHEKGIVHRDLKPANIKLTPEDKVKVLDFGLAKAYETQPSPSPSGRPLPMGEVSNSPTLISMAATNAGLILGTAAYMSPEQARGKPVDKRTDIWAFGVVLFEMLTGRRLFDGTDITETLAAVIKEEPDLNKVPAKVRSLLKRCLEKDPKKRLQDLGDLGLLLEPDAVTTRGVRLPWAIASILAAALIISSFLRWQGMEYPKPADRPLMRLDVDLGAETSGSAGSLLGIILSPDGSRLAYVAQSRLFTRRLDQPGVVELAGTEGASFPFFSPDGQWIGFFTGGNLKKISVEGGAALTLSQATNGKGGSWGEDGRIIGSLNGQGLESVSSAGGTAMGVTDLKSGEVAHRWPQILPGGKAVLFSANPNSATAWDAANIEVMSLQDRRRRTLVRGGTFGRYVAAPEGTGYLTYVNRGTLFAVRFDLEGLEVRGAPSSLLSDVAYSSNFGFATTDFSQTGTMVYVSGGASGGKLNVQWLDSNGKTQPLSVKPGFYQRPRLSPDGQRLALTVTEGSNQDIWVYEFQRDTLSRLTFGGGANDSPVWSPDGRFIAFLGAGGMFGKRSDGAGKVQVLTQSKAPQYPFSFSPDGRLAYLELGTPGGYDLWTLPLEIDGSGLKPGKPEVFLQTPYEERHPAFSPDGRWIAYSSNESGVFQVYVRAFPDKSSKWQISTNGGVYPVFTRTGQKLFFRTEDNQVMLANYTVQGDSFVADKPRVWSETRLADLGIILNYDVAPDGKRVLALMPSEAQKGERTPSHVTFMVNFADEIRRRLGGNK